MRPGRTSGKARRRRVMAAARTAVRLAGPDLARHLPTDAVTVEAIEVQRPTWAQSDGMVWPALPVRDDP